MREIKFRIWHKKTKFMDAWEVLKKLHTQTWAFEDDYQVPLQYTGLKDKNGKEIYEGDIVRKYSEVNMEYGFQDYQVKWNIVRACFDLNALDYGGQLYKTQEKLEVLGNIYEDKELLND